MSVLKISCTMIIPEREMLELQYMLSLFDVAQMNSQYF